MAKAVKSSRNKKKGVSDVVSIRKSNDLVEARYRFDIWETRLFTRLLSMIHTNDKDFNEYKIYINDLIQDFNLTSDKNAYALFKQGAKKLMQKIITVVSKDKETDKWTEFHTPIVVSLRNPLEEEDASYVKIGFHPEMRPFLLELKERYLVYDFANVSQLRSPYYVRIYELLKQYEKIGWRKFEVQKLKDILGINEEYKLYGHFKSRILDKAQENLLGFTDIAFTYEEIKQGRSVHEIIFHIYQNNPTKRKPTSSYRVPKSPTLFDTYEELPDVKQGRVEAQDFTAKENNLLFEQVFLQVKIWGITEDVLNLLFDTQSEEAILSGLIYTQNAQKQGKIKENPAGFFIKAVKERYTDVNLDKQIQKEKRQVERQQKEILKREYQGKVAQLRDKHDQQRNTIVRQLTAENDEPTLKAIAALQGDLQIYFKIKNLDPQELTIEYYRQEPVLRVFVIEKMQLLFSEEFKELEPLKKEIANLEAELAKLG